jgi:hypothetical protein
MRLETEPHYHRRDEYLVFLGAKLPDVFSSFDTLKCTSMLEKTLVFTMEKIVITEPTIVKLPRKTTGHSPLDFVRIDKPLLSRQLCLKAPTGMIKYVEREDGEPRSMFILKAGEPRPVYI